MTDMTVDEINAFVQKSLQDHFGDRKLTGKDRDEIFSVVTRALVEVATTFKTRIEVSLDPEDPTRVNVTALCSYTFSDAFPLSFETGGCNGTSGPGLGCRATGGATDTENGSEEAQAPTPTETQATG